jgi:outer membrane lipoprotein-sorting protein
MNYKYIKSFLCAAIIALFLCGAAQSYVLPGKKILMLTLENYGRAKSLFVRQTVTIYNKTENIDKTYNETLRYLFPDKFRADIDAKDGKKISVICKDEFFDIINDNIVKKYSKTIFDIYKDILLYRDISVLTQNIENLDIDISTSSFGRYEGKICFVIGADYPEKMYSQLFIDKQTFLPLVLKTFFDNKSVEVKYSNWVKERRTYYPYNIEVYINNVLRQEIIVEKVWENVDFPKNSFDIDSVKKNNSKN